MYQPLMGCSLLWLNLSAIDLLSASLLSSTEMRLLTFFLFAIANGLVGLAQFYPEAKAYWRGVDDNGGPPFFNVAQVMPIFPDTLINGTTYKKIRENNDASGSSQLIRDHFVRSDTSGKGYVYIPDSAAEFLTGDLNAQAGDTVHDVLVSLTNSTDIDYFYRDLVVDSVVTLLVEGDPRTRWYINGDDFGGLLLFWQDGMGTISGPMLEMSGEWWNCCVNDTVQFGSGPCPQWITDVGEALDAAPAIMVGPNPSNGIFRFSVEYPQRFAVLNAQGAFLLSDHSSVIDLTGRPPGLYLAVVATPLGNYPLRLVVER